MLLLLVAAALLAALGSSWPQRLSGRARWLSSLSSSLSSSLMLRARGNGAVAEGQIPTKTKRSAVKSTEAIWGLQLGEVVRDIQCETFYTKHRPEAGPLGLDYAPRAKAKSRGWEVIKATLQVFRAKYGDLLVPRRFKVPHDEPWPEDMWGKGLVLDRRHSDGPSPLSLFSNFESHNLEYHLAQWWFMS